MPGALEGIRVLETAYFLAGPYVGLLLASMGAEVIKVEPPGVGDPTRLQWPFVDRQGFVNSPEHPDHISLSILKRAQGKKSITLNLKTDRGKQLFLDLARRSDVVVENFQPGTMQRLGLDFEAVRSVNPRIIYCSVSGFGQTGPYREKLAFDQIIQAMSGLMSINGAPGTPPVRAGFSIADLSAPLFATIAVLGALRYRDQGGPGQHLDVAMLDCLTSMIWEENLDWFVANDVPLRQGNVNGVVGPADCYATRDGNIFLVCVTDEHWRRLVKVLDIAEAFSADRFATPKLRFDNRHEINAVIGPWFAAHTTEQVLAVLGEYEVPCGPVRSIPESLEDPQVKHRGALQHLPHPVSHEPSVALGSTFPVKFSDMALRTHAPAPLLGEHNAEIYGGVLGLSSGELEELRRTGVV